MGTQGGPFLTRFWKRIEVRGPNECWIWNGARNPYNYGVLQTRAVRGGRASWVMAHRLAWEIANATPAHPTLEVIHNCDNPPCCNPSHLSLGTHAENMRDYAVKYRAFRARRKRPEYRMHPSLTYLACPYSHPDRAVRVGRFNAVNIVAGQLMRQGHLVFSPISHTHPIAEAGGLPLGWEFWAAFDRAYLEASRELIVLRLDGWRESVGVTAELAIAKELRIPVSYIDSPAVESAA